MRLDDNGRPMPVYQLKPGERNAPPDRPAPVGTSRQTTLTASVVR